jgi:protease-4
LDQYGIADRRRLRHKLTFWRLACFVALAVIVVGIGYYFSPPAGSDRPHIARVEVSGLIGDDQDLIRRLDRIAANDAAKALIVEINSPGGTTYGGEAIFNAIRGVAVKKPVVSEIRTLGASAAYMVAAAGDHIVASQASVVGSIGVLFQYPEVAGLLDKVGVGVNEIKSAPLKAEPSPFHPPSDAAKAMIRSVVMDTYGWFVDLVAERRHMPRDKALQLSDGRVFTGRQALQNGLIDELGSDEQVLKWLAGKGISSNLPVIEAKPAKSSGWGFFGKAASGVIGALADNDAPFGSVFGRLADRKLFLDGLVSLWQFGPQQADIQ